LKRWSGIPEIRRFCALIAGVKTISGFFRPFPKGAEGSRVFLHLPPVVRQAAGFPEPIDQEPWVPKEILYMKTVIWIVVIFAAWYALNRWILPKLGVPT
jgi:hypothetical protein